MTENIDNWGKYSGYFGTYANKIKPFYESGELEKLQSFLRGEKEKKRLMAPESKNIFRCFTELPISDIKCFVIALCPYHTFKDSKPIANGLPMGTDNGILQPSLSNFYKAMSTEFEVEEGDMNMVSNTDWLMKQGVFLYNVGLTVERGKAGNHNKEWEKFSKHVFETIIAPTSAPVVFLGKECAKFKKYLLPFQWSFQISHPASAAYSGEDWDSEGVFKKVNKILKDVNGFEIDWCNRKPQEIIINQYLPWDMPEND